MSDSIKEAFLLACSQGNLERLRAAVTLGVDVNVKGGPWGGSGLAIAISANREHIVKELMANPKVDVNATDKDGDNAMAEACANGRIWAVKILAKASTFKGINQKGNFGRTPLIWAVRGGIVV